MNEITYVGERLVFGQLGHFAVILSFVSALIGAIAYFRGHNHNTLQAGFLRIGRFSFLLHAISVFTIIGLLFYLMFDKAYEYLYVWQHVSDDLPAKYLFAAFWEGQEGSFLLWLFWHIILGMVILRYERRLEAPVMGMLLAVQVVISSMLLGVYIWDDGMDVVKIGSNPFILLRQEMDAPIFTKADYLLSITGNGLNPLLQNYWMTIHPPTLFLGFAATTIPFCYAAAGLMEKDHHHWLKPVFPWSLFAAGILGTGILMGGAWAYEALSFGGYWAWDPVENMSLVPWLVLIAGLHTNLIARNTGHAIRSTYIFYWLAFILIVYSTFLTRSGILGDTSVHAFTEMGLEWQLVGFLMLFTLWGAWLIFRHWRTIPAPVKEEATWSREFWMFIGSLTLLFSAILISFTTSIPVYNKLFDAAGWMLGKDFSDLHRTSPLDPVAHYNKYQLWIAVFVAILSAVALYLRYKLPVQGALARKALWYIGGSVGLAAITHLLVYSQLNIQAWQYHILLFSALFAVYANIGFTIGYIRRDLRQSASAVSHFGFAILILGVIASGLNKTYISSNPFAQRGLLDNQSEEELGKNITLLKGVPMMMSGYEVVYESDSLDGIFREFHISFKKRDAAGEVTESFSLSPNILYDRSFTKVAASNPDTKHYLHKDIFTHIHSLPPEEVNIDLAREKEDSLQYLPYSGRLGDTLFTTGHFAEIAEIADSTQHPDYKSEPRDQVLGVTLLVRKLNDDRVWTAHPFIVIREGVIYNFPFQVNELNMKVRLKDEALRQLLDLQAGSPQSTLTLKLGQSADYGDFTIKVEQIDQQANHPNYIAQQDDIPIHVRLSVRDKRTGAAYEANPVYVIRDSKIYTVNDYLPQAGLLFRFASLDPGTEELRIQVAHQPMSQLALPLEISENSARSDFIVLEAIVFPGINFVWIGSIMLMLGLFMGAVYRINARKS